MEVDNAAWCRLGIAERELLIERKKKELLERHVKHFVSSEPPTATLSVEPPDLPARPTFSLAYTSVRHAMVKPVICDWIIKAKKHRDIEVVVCLEVYDRATQSLANELINSGLLPEQVKFEILMEKGNCVKGWNQAAQATTGKVIVAISDDFTPPTNWDELLLGAGYPGWINKPHVMHVEDGFVSHICTIPILTRSRYLSQGYLFYPEYESMFVDTEFTEVAYRDGVVIQAKHLLFEHHHYNIAKRDSDEHDIAHAGHSRWMLGEELFNRRKAAGFPPLLVVAGT